MNVTARCLFLAFLVAMPLVAQKTEPPPDPTADFDYLLGDWEFDAVSKQWGKFQGRWSAVKLAEGHILDEYRIVDGDGGTIYVTTTLRNYNREKKVWDLIGADAGGGLRDFGTAQKKGGEVHVEQTFGASTDKPSVWRIRYYNIRPDAFSWVADRSDDGGKSWTPDFQTIEARRIGPRRGLPPLTRSK